MNWRDIENKISSSIGRDFKVAKSRSIGGGSINSAYQVEDEKDQFFVKLNGKQHEAMFVAEAEGLSELNKPACIHVPNVICYGCSASHSFIVMEYIDCSTGNANSSRKLGEQLAMLHQYTGSDFGWRIDNTIGSTAQINTPSDNWLKFYREHRLQFQIALAIRNGYARDIKDLGNELCENLGLFFRGYQPTSSLLHGDLWSGNYTFDENSNPVIFDPAVYYGDRETDMAMTELFGGFSANFYDAYNDVYPLDDGYQVRKTLYNLYHILNHLNLFGGGYYSQSIGMMKKLLSEIN